MSNETPLEASQRANSSILPLFLAFSGIWAHFVDGKGPRQSSGGRRGYHNVSLQNDEIGCLVRYFRVFDKFIQTKITVLYSQLCKSNKSIEQLFRMLLSVLEIIII